MTHAQLARELGDHPALAGLRSAAAESANPAVRNVATVGGNLCAVGFSAADLVPALLALDAQVELLDRDVRCRVKLVDFVASESVGDASPVTARNRGRRTGVPLHRIAAQTRRKDLGP